MALQELEGEGAGIIGKSDDKTEKGHSTLSKEPIEEPSDMLYGLDDNPPWYLCLIYGFQQYMAMVGGTISQPIILASILCLASDDPARGTMVSSIIFVSGVITFMQSSLGVRLPIVQGGNYSYLIPTLALLDAMFEPCQTLQHTESHANLTAVVMEARTEDWQVRLRYIQGSIATSSIIQVILGFTGILGVILPFITPLTVVPTVTLVGLSLFQLASEQGAEHWPVCFMTIVLTGIFSQYMREICVPCPLYSTSRGFYTVACYPFMTLSLLLAMVISWSVCWVLTVTNVISKGSPARTDIRGQLMHNTPWFHIPYPGQFGTPTVSVAGTVGMVACVFASIIESVGDYYTAARVVGASMPPKHAINRGIGVEGLGSLLAGLVGTGSGTTSYSGNIGILAITKVGSRRMIQYSAVIMMVCGVLAKVGAMFVMIPEPILAGVFFIKFSMVTAMGLSTLQYVNLSSSRNIFILGFSLFFGISFPKWLEGHPDVIQTGSVLADQTLTVLLQTSMFIGGTIGILLDNTIPGTDLERGVLQWRAMEVTPDSSSLQHSPYDLPFVMSCIRQSMWLQYLPFCPTFRGFVRRKSTENRHIMT